MISLAIVCPCYNEEECLRDSAEKLRTLLREMIANSEISDKSFILFVNDGSKDTTWRIISELHATDKCFHGLNLAHNVGHQNAILAGMVTAVETADAVVTIDVDLQDDIATIPRMVQDYYKGYDVVYGVRASRHGDSFMKKFTAQSFYKLQSKLGAESIYNHADFRFMSRRVVLELEKYSERNLYLRGLIPMIGFPSTIEEFHQKKRLAGETKYTPKKMLQLAMNGITSFSITPIYWILGLGGIFLLIAIVIGVYALVSLISGHVVPGWTSLILSIWFVGGMILIAMGVVGLYVGRVYIETKRRPRYHIQDRLE